MATGKSPEQTGENGEDQAGATTARVEPRNGEARREDDEAGKQGDRRVKRDDPQGGCRDPDAFVQVASVGQDRPHPQAEREECLSQSRGVDRDVEKARQVWAEIVGQPLGGPRQRERPRGEEKEQADEGGHERFGHALDAGTNATKQDQRRCSQHQKCQTDAGGCVCRELRKEGADRLLVPAHAPSQRKPRVCHGPAGDHAIEREDTGPGEHAENPDEPPAGSGTQEGKRPDGRLLCPSADRDLGDHDRKADKRDAHEVDEHECGATALSHSGGKAPDVAQPDGGTRRRKDEAGSCTPTTAYIHETGGILPDLAQKLKSWSTTCDSCVWRDDRTLDRMCAPAADRIITSYARGTE